MSAASPKDKIHPATRVFQALRIFVNDELGELATGAFRGRAVLKPGGRLVVVTLPFAGRPHRQALHRRPLDTGSRLAHHAAGAGQGRRLSKSAAMPSAPARPKLRANPRARSAKLRAAVRTGAPPRDADFPSSGCRSCRKPARSSRRVRTCFEQRHRADRVMVGGRRLHLQDQARRREPAIAEMRKIEAQIRSRRTRSTC
jgi:hypothetical protein